jgi:trk/ktr system potassium uptake protein
MDCAAASTDAEDSMRYVIVGCGRLGSMLATALSEEQHQVAVVDRDASAFQRLGRAFGGQRVSGVAFDRNVLETAGIANADGFATMTNGDNANFVLAAMARWRYRVPRVVARIYDPVRADIYARLGIPTVSPTMWGSARVKELLTYGQMTPLLDIGDGDVEVVEVEAGALLQGHSASDLMIPETMHIIAVVRNGRGLIPSAATVLQARDLLQIAVRASARGQLSAMLGMQ